MKAVTFLFQQAGHIETAIHAQSPYFLQVAVDKTTTDKDIAHTMADRTGRTDIDHQIGLQTIKRIGQVIGRLHLADACTQVAHLHFVVSPHTGKFQFRKFTLNGVSNQYFHCNFILNLYFTIYVFSASTYSSKASTPCGVILQSVQGIFPLNVFVTST